MSRLLSRIALGDAGTTIAVSSSTSTGAFDGVTALTGGTITISVSGTSSTGVAFAAGSTLMGDITSVIVSSGGPFALYKRTV